MFIFRFSTKESAAHAIVSTHNTEVGCHTVKCSWGKESGDPNNLQNSTQVLQVRTQVLAALTEQDSGTAGTNTGTSGTNRTELRYTAGTNTGTGGTNRTGLRYCRYEHRY